MPALNQPIFRSNAIKHYMQGREKHEFPRFVSLPTTILLWVLLALFVVATILVWSEQVPTYVATQGIVVIQYAAQPAVQPTAQSVTQPTVQPTTQPTAQPAPAARRLVSATRKSVWVIRKSALTVQRPTPAMEELASITEKPTPVSEESASAGGPVPATQKSASVAQQPIPTIGMAVFFLPPVQAQSLHAGMPINLNISSSGQHINSQITNIVPGVMTPAALRSFFHLENISLSITQPSRIVVVKLDNALATRYVGSLVTANLQVGSQRLISFLPGIGGLFGE
jgi:hypothetical protein